MPLSTGTHLGPYEIIAPLGSGGMGEVYRARDTKLNRDVAIKVLPESFAHDPDRLARFEREAQLLASLNHPNIGAIYGLEESNVPTRSGQAAVQGLVLELVEGPTLADRIAQGAMPLDEALTIARQIAEALEAAHEQGVIHRDLKPANIKLRTDGTVKVLDFGLAKLAEPPAASGAGAASLSQSPTITTPAMMTGIGVILGTAAYMSPEQAKGRPADKRSDVWAFGCVLYEMLTGKRAFGGDDVSDTLAFIITKDPDWSALPSEAPPAIRRLLRRCLSKTPRERIPDIGIVRLEIDEPPDAQVAEVAPTRGRLLSNAVLAWSVAGTLLVIASMVIAYVQRTSTDTPEYQASILPPDEVALNGIPAARFSLSPDGRRLAFVGKKRDGDPMLWLRPLAAVVAQPLPGTEGASAPFWSPDSRWIGFFAGGKLKKIEASGGPPLTLCDTEVVASAGAGATWSKSGVILFATIDGPRAGRLQRVSPAGSTPVPIATTPDERNRERWHTWPYFLPDGRHFLYFAAGPREGRGVFVASIDSSERKLLVEGGSNAKYAQGYLLFQRETTLMALRFDPDRLATSGEAVPIAQQVAVGGSSGQTGAFSVTEAGVLAYQTSTAETGAQLVWLDRTGKQIGVLGNQARYTEVNLSPDGKRATVTLLDRTQGNSDIWLFDVARGFPTRLTFDPADDQTPAWSPDGGRIVFTSRRKGHFDLYQKASSGAGGEDLLLADESDKDSMSWSPDGRFILYGARGATSGNDFKVLPMSGDRKPFSFAKSRFASAMGQFSPDGRWIAYVSTETGRQEVDVAPFPGAGGKWQVSTAGGNQPRWRRDGKEIFYASPDGKLTAAVVNGQGASFEVDAARPLFEFRPTGSRYSYDVSPDGQRFLVITRVDEAAPSPITLVVSWTAGLKK